MGIIVAIGGGSIGFESKPTTTPIDKEIIRLSGKKKPNFLFIPTASSDDEGYIRLVEKHFGQKLGCRVDALKLIQETQERKEIVSKIGRADIIYVGGGNTLKMMRRWRSLGVDKLLKAAYQRGTVLSGLSAGMLCWFSHGHSDSMYYYNPKNWKYIRVRCLNFIPLLACPHYDVEKKRRTDFEKIVLKYRQIGIALDNDCAFVLKGDSYRILSARKGAHATRVAGRSGKVQSQIIPAQKTFSPLSEILK